MFRGTTSSAILFGRPISVLRLLLFRILTCLLRPGELLLSPVAVGKGRAHQTAHRPFDGPRLDTIYGGLAFRQSPCLQQTDQVALPTWPTSGFTKGGVFAAAVALRFSGVICPLLGLSCLLRLMFSIAVASHGCLRVPWLKRFYHCD